MPEGYVSPHVSKLIDEQLLAQTGSQLGDLDDWLLMSGRGQPDALTADDPADFKDDLEIEIESADETRFIFDFL